MPLILAGMAKENTVYASCLGQYVAHRGCSMSLGLLPHFLPQKHCFLPLGVDFHRLRVMLPRDLLGGASTSYIFSALTQRAWSDPTLSSSTHWICCLTNPFGCASPYPAGQQCYEGSSCPVRLLQG